MKLPQKIAAVFSLNIYISDPVNRKLCGVLSLSRRVVTTYHIVVGSPGREKAAIVLGSDTPFPLSPQVLTELKSDNQRLKDENGALIRVISKLSK